MGGVGDGGGHCWLDQIVTSWLYDWSDSGFNPINAVLYDLE